MPGERRDHGRPAPPRAPARPRARPPGGDVGLAREPHGPATGLAPAAGVGRRGALRGDDPEAAWAEAIGGARVLAEACDGAHPRALVDAVVEAGRAGDDGTRRRALAELRSWLGAAEDCRGPRPRGRGRAVARPDPPGGRGRAGGGARPGAAPPQLDHRPGPPDPAGAVEHGMLTAVLWQQARRAEVSVMGLRLSVRPIIAQDDAGDWTLAAGPPVDEDRNAVDHLVRHALDELARLTETG
ncbi:MAG: hypothetical protein U5R31_00020 [Acidimicrobiia bacterium]|nr:hypothetical protein [Acidimicrobiia bacterium]